VALKQISVIRNGAQQFGSITTLAFVGSQAYINDPLPPAGTGSGWMRWNGSSWTLLSPANVAPAGC
jgi:hypothetical protein